jgi:hypothetical protein
MKILGSVALRCRGEEIGRVALERKPLFPELHRQRIELLRSGERAPVVAPQLPLADPVLDTSKDDAGTAERFESKHRSSDALDRPVVLLNDVVEVLTLPNRYRRVTRKRLLESRIDSCRQILI